MKKLLLLASILAVSGVTFSAESAGSKAEKTGKLNVSVNIVQNLEMKTKDLDFGFLVPGESKTIQPDSSNAGEIVISGTKGAYVKVSFQDLNNPVEGKFNHNIVLTRDGGNNNSPEDKINVTMHMNDFGWKPDMVTDDAIIGLNRGTSQNGKANGVINVGGSITANQNQNVGKYTGTMLVRAVYEGSMADFDPKK